MEWRTPIPCGDPPPFPMRVLAPCFNHRGQQVELSQNPRSSLGLKRQHAMRSTLDHVDGMDWAIRGVYGSGLIVFEKWGALESLSNGESIVFENTCQHVFLCGSFMCDSPSAGRGKREQVGNGERKVCEVSPE
ncbi:unnamed protein product [Leuciscus chuanchicus]